MNPLYHLHFAQKRLAAQDLLLRDIRPRYQALRRAVREFGPLDRDEVTQALTLLDEIFDCVADKAIVAAVDRWTRSHDVYSLLPAIERIRREDGSLASADGCNVHDFIRENATLDLAVDDPVVQSAGVSKGVPEKLNRTRKGQGAQLCGGEFAGYVEFEPETNIGADADLDLNKRSVGPDPSARGIGGEIAAEDRDLRPAPVGEAVGEIALVPADHVADSICGDVASEVDLAESVNADEDWAHRDFLNVADVS